MGLALDIGLAGLALGIERVEGEVEIMLGRFAGVDRAALRFSAVETGFTGQRLAPVPSARMRIDSQRLRQAEEASSRSSACL